MIFRGIFAIYLIYKAIISFPCLVGLLLLSCVIFCQLTCVKTVYGLFWPPTFFWLFTGRCLFRSALMPDGVRIKTLEASSPTELSPLTGLGETGLVTVLPSFDP